MDYNQIISAALCLVTEWNKLTDEQMKQIELLPFDFSFALGDLHDSTLENSPCIAGNRLPVLS